MLLRCTILTFLSLFILTGCAPFSPSPRDAQGELPASMPAQYMSAHTPGNSVTNATSPWWESFKNKDLDSLMAKALGTNFDILTAWARLRQSQAAANKALAEFFPQIDIDGRASQHRTSTQTDVELPSSQTLSESFNINLTASYELDFWGRVRSQRQAELLRHEATRNDLQTAAITVAGSVADTWIKLLGNRAELAVLNEQITINEDLVKVQIDRFNNGLSTSLEVLQQQAILAETKAEVPVLEQEAAVLRNQLAILQGTLPGAGLKIDENAPLPTLDPIPDPGLPIQLLEARPDISAAWARLEASDWDVSVARANRLPTLRLTATQVFDAAKTTLLFGNWVASLAASLATPLFDGGALIAEEARVRAETDVNVQNYARTVATAIQEVDNALAAEKGESENLRLIEEQYKFTQAALLEAHNSYLGGITDFLNFVVELKSIQSLQRTIARQKTTVVQARIALYRTLGSLQFPLTNEFVPAPASAKNNSITPK